eukprot:TRINITY_DN9878_c0_g1_i1.p1 TRINITY_DN9878_c0_g1~~TRINITY_DN9878_c0_g1_i1.p1  ORF type:complete len:162 (+),score=24.31 TRINITY_DN9878_c0_g1_i1:100-585(+)
MEEPLFGEKKKPTTVAFWVFVVIVTLIALVSIILGLVYGIKNPEHIVLSVSVLFTWVVFVILTKWFRDGDLDSKFKFLIGLTVVVLLMISFATIYYSVKKPPKIPELPQCDGLYSFASQTCYPLCPSGTCMDMDYFLCNPTYNCNVTASSTTTTNAMTQFL